MSDKLRFETVQAALQYAKDERLRVVEHISVRGGMRLQCITRSGRPSTLNVRPPAATPNPPQATPLERVREGHAAHAQAAGSARLKHRPPRLST